MKRKLEKMLWLTLAKLSAIVRPGWGTGIQLRFYKKYGMRINGTPNYISSRIWFDGTDYSLISLGDGCTISSYVRVLTHDWSPHTILKSMGLTPSKPVGRIDTVTVGAGAFVGTGCILMPGCEVGERSIVGSGSVVRGKVEPYTIVAGSPAIVVGDVRDFLAKRYPEELAQAGGVELSAS